MSEQSRGKILVFFFFFQSTFRIQEKGQDKGGWIQAGREQFRLGIRRNFSVVRVGRPWRQQLAWLQPWLLDCSAAEASQPPGTAWTLQVGSRPNPGQRHCSSRSVQQKERKMLQFEIQNSEIQVRMKCL